MLLTLDSLFFNSVSLSLKETINTNRLNKINIICKNKKFRLLRMARNCKTAIKKIKVKKTRYLNTAIMQRECIMSLNKDMCANPKYLFPLIEFISLYFLMCFLKVPEKLLHRLALLDKISKSFFVRQL